jgi:transcriptional regulator with XRE-family HTH domain
VEGVDKMCKKTLRQLRLENDLTQERLAQRTGLTLKSISNYESDVNRLRNASYANILKIANILGVEVNQIFLG